MTMEMTVINAGDSGSSDGNGNDDDSEDGIDDK